MNTSNLQTGLSDPIDGTLTGTTTLGQRELGSKGNEEVPHTHTPQE